jgi:hypothetical protein
MESVQGCGGVMFVDGVMVVRRRRSECSLISKGERGGGRGGRGGELRSLSALLPPAYRGRATALLHTASDLLLPTRIPCTPSVPVPI